MNFPTASLTKNDKKANIFILSVSAIVFLAVVVLHELNLKIQVDFDPHIFAKFNAIINGSVSLLLLLGLFLLGFIRAIIRFIISSEGYYYLGYYY